MLLAAKLADGDAWHFVRKAGKQTKKATDVPVPRPDSGCHKFPLRNDRQEEGKVFCTNNRKTYVAAGTV